MGLNFQPTEPIKVPEEKKVVVKEETKKVSIFEDDLDSLEKIFDKKDKTNKTEVKPSTQENFAGDFTF